ncbi:unnamed protein product [Somion occarium]|uniref:Myb-like domain-containing protein n=1 Tax=Somion occarium TaxID=3059160 RepID=A0ABP1CGX0_9APHY
MSSRVQKGSTIFRPIAKPRARQGTESRQTSVTPAPEPRHGSTVGNAQPPEAATSSVSVAQPMGPPSIIPSRHSTQTGSAKNNRESSNAEATNLQGSQPSQSIAVPTRESSRPPAVPLASPQRSLNVPRPPPIISSGSVPVIQPTKHSHAPPTISGNAESSRNVAAPIPITVPTARPIAVPSSSRQTSSATTVPQSYASTTTSALQIETASTNIENAQIDPALLEAVVAALRHVDQAQTQHAVEPAPITGPSTSGLNGEPSQAAPATHKSQVRKPRMPSAENGNSTGEPARPRRTRTKRVVNDENVTQEEADSSEAATPGEKRLTKRRRTSRGTSEFQTEEAGSGSEGEADSATPRRRRRTRRSKAPSPPPFDSTADPGEELDPTAVTMGALCDDLGTGRISSKAAQIVSNHATWRSANRAKRARMKAIMEAKKYGRDLEEEEEARLKEGSTPPDKTLEATPVLDVNAEAGPSNIIEDLGIHKGDGFDYSQTMTTTRFSAQVRIGPNGEMIVDEESLFVDRIEEAEDMSGYTHVEESDTTKFVNSATYSKKVRGSRWSAEETELFFDALSQFGENYELISYVLPGRDRKACKNKFKAEDRKNPARITYCLTNRRPYGMLDFVFLGEPDVDLYKILQRYPA